MDYRKITPEDAHFLTKVFSVPEYDLYFAENETTEEDWRERIALFDDVQSLIVSDGSKDVGWLMYRTEGESCFIDIIVLLPEERHHGYGKQIIADLLVKNPEIKTIKLDVQQRNHSAVAFYKKTGFRVAGEEYQPVNGVPVGYDKMEWTV